MLKTASFSKVYIYCGRTDFRKGIHNGIFITALFPELITDPSGKVDVADVKKPLVKVVVYRFYVNTSGSFHELRIYGSKADHCVSAERSVRSWP